MPKALRVTPYFANWLGRRRRYCTAQRHEVTPLEVVVSKEQPELHPVPVRALLTSSL